MIIKTPQLLEEGKTNLQWLKSGKNKRKLVLLDEQGGLCGNPDCPNPELPRDPRLLDLTRPADHPYSKRDYRDKSICKVQHARCHQEVDHGNIPWFGHLRMLVQSRAQIQKTRVKIENRIDAVLRGMDDPNSMPASVKRELESLKETEEDLTSEIDGLMKNAQPIAKSAIKVLGVGTNSIAPILDFLQPFVRTARHRSAFHHLAGYVPGFDKTPEREMDENGQLKRGEKRHYIKYLRVHCFNQAVHLIMSGVGRIKKAEWPELDADEREARWIAMTWREKYAVGLRHGQGIYALDYLRRRAKTEADRDWTESHGNMDAIRVMMKLFLSHLWQKWCEIEGLEVTKPYVVDKLEHNYLKPFEQ